MGYILKTSDNAQVTGLSSSADLNTMQLTGEWLDKAIINGAHIYHSNLFGKYTKSGINRTIYHLSFQGKIGYLFADDMQQRDDLPSKGLTLPEMIEQNFVYHVEFLQTGVPLYKDVQCTHLYGKVQERRLFVSPLVRPDGYNSLIDRRAGERVLEIWFDDQKLYIQAEYIDYWVAERQEYEADYTHFDELNKEPLTEPEVATVPFNWLLTGAIVCGTGIITYIMLKK